jgi:hypothetical protein
VTIDSRTAARILTRLARCQRRNKDLSTKVVQLTHSRDQWKQKATKYRLENKSLRRKHQPRKKPCQMEYGHEYVKRILAIPPRDIK